MLILNVLLFVSLAFGVVGASLINKWDGTNDVRYIVGYLMVSVAVGIFVGLVIVSN